MKTTALFRSTICAAALLLFGVSSTKATLVLYYSFNDGAASATDFSGNGHSGTINGPIYSAPGGGYNNTPGRSMEFNGFSDIIVVDDGATAFDSLMTTGAATISFWVFGDVLGDPRPGSPCTNFSAFNGSGIRQLMGHVPWEDGVVYFDTAGQTPGVNRIFKDATADQFEGRWNHWMFIKDGSGPTGLSSIYLNNTLFHSGTTTAAFDNIENFYVGGNGQNGNEGYHGLIDEFAVWDHALSPAERTTVFNGTIPEPASAAFLVAAGLMLVARRARDGDRFA